MDLYRSLNPFGGPEPCRLYLVDCWWYYLTFLSSQVILDFVLMHSCSWNYINALDANRLKESSYCGWLVKSDLTLSQVQMANSDTSSDPAKVPPTAVCNNKLDHSYTCYCTSVTVHKEESSFKGNFCFQERHGLLIKVHPFCWQVSQSNY